MLFTRTIRRKMLVGVALVLAMLSTLSLGGISGLFSYRNLVQELDWNINEAPRRTDLTASTAILLEPLLLTDPQHREEFGRFQQVQFQQRLARAQQEVLEFHSKLDRLPPSPAVLARRPLIEAQVKDIDRGIQNLNVMQRDLSDPRKREQVAAAMLQEAAYIQAVAHQVPDSLDGLNGMLDQGRRAYRSRFKILLGTSAFAVALFCGFLRYIHVGIVSPLRKLHQGALRVAQGDFDYRVRLGCHDEMSELAEAFNKMTTRFQEVAHELDLKVQERSKQLVRSERLATVGFLSAGVAHEINNPLQAITTAADALRERADGFLEQADPADQKVVRTYLEMIQRESERCKQITTKLLDFSRAQDTTRAAHDLTSIIHEVIALVGHLKKYRDRKIDFDHAESCRLNVNGAEIKQVVLNLVSNALESMEPGGTLKIRIIEQTDQVLLSFEDDGCGMTTEILENLFEPFFTRRKSGKGTGLGMSISHRIVSDHGGTIEVASPGPGCGSTFRIHLPRRPAGEKAAA